MLFIKKPGGGLYFYVNYRALNAITRHDQYPLPLICKTLWSLAKSQWFTKINVHAAFHCIRIKEGDKWKTAFWTRFRLFKWLVTPFSLTGAPTIFQCYINSTLSKFLDIFCSAYIDDVLIYSDGSYKDYMEKVCKVIARLREAGLCLDINKCKFAAKEVKYLGFIISIGEGIKVDPEKVAAIRSWEAPINVKGVQSFLGFTNFYREFIKEFSKLSALLSCLTYRGEP